MASDEEARRLAEAASELALEVTNLNEGFGKQSTRLARIARKNRRMIYGLIISMILDVALTIGLSVGFTTINDNTHRISALTHRLDVAQSVQRQKALCPLYQLFEDSKKYPAPPPAEGQSAKDAATQRQHAFQIIDQGYEALNCQDYLQK